MGNPIEHEIQEQAILKGGSWKDTKIYTKPKSPQIVTYIFNHSGGIIKNDKQATYVIAALCTAIIIISFYIAFGKNKTQKLPPEVEQYFIENKIQLPY